ncbi:uncharacterized protein [Fopius arisanus]|uniref:Uncharacterized protein isoform X1 n=1 Tax=Fopius arisanus TaxID=64838 RepID=A0A9R1U3K4_9HYME|nr:PREDICTED: uncharacterized protein LOC105269334 isoform X1 [Fopius arisanus]XP_011307782.1 PREDICTED: uncharacterized protein LOC105269334 isoform X2 [Fopius arisanus]
MASRFILLLLTIVATLSEVKSENWALPVALGQFPFIAIIRYSNGPVAIGALIARRLVLGSAAHMFRRPVSIMIQLGCISVRNCYTPQIPVSEDYDETYPTLIIFRLMAEAELSDTIRIIPFAPPRDYSNLMCEYVGLNGRNGIIYWMPVRLSDRQSCLKKRVNVPENHACFQDFAPSIILPDKTLGGSIICGERLVGMMSMYSVLHKTGPHRMYDLTTNARQRAGMQRFL